MPLAVPMNLRHLANLWPLPLSPHNAGLRAENLQVVGPRRQKVCIVGAGNGRTEAPLDDPAWEVWALNAVPPYDAERRLRADRWFDLHQRVAQNADDLKWIAECPFPLYVPDDLLDGGPNTVAFPLAAVEARFGSYFSCTFAYQIALVLHEGVATDLGLFGVELAFGTDRERTVEWACVAYWLGRAEERGLTVHLPRESTLGRHPFRYGFEYQQEIDAVKDYTSLMRMALRTRDIAGSVEE